MSTTVKTMGEDIQNLITLYNVEANLVQEKINHILTIRTIAFSLLVGIVGASVIYSSTDLLILVLILIPFYVLEAVYDAYKVRIVEREVAIRDAISEYYKSTGYLEIASKYEQNIDYGVTPKSWTPLRRALLEPVRIGMYASLMIIPVIIQFGPAICSFFGEL